MIDIEKLNIDNKYKKWLKTISYVVELNDTLIDSFKKHSRLNDTLPFDYRDIFNFKSVDDFIKYIDTLESDSEVERRIKLNGSQTIFDSDDFSIKYVFTKEAMFLFGKGSRWCISSDENNPWDKYTRNGDIFYLVTCKKLPYNSQFKKFVVQISKNKNISVWDRSDIRYHSNIFDLIKIDKNVFFSHVNITYINVLLSYIDVNVLNILKKNNAIIAGGVFTSIISKKPINDIDIWFSNDVDYKNTIKEFEILTKGDGISNIVRSYTAVFTTKFAHTFSINEKKYQIINPSIYTMGNVKDIINQFDFKCVMCGYSLKDGFLEYDKNFFKDVNNRLININPNLRNKVNLLGRVIKYTNKGFNVRLSTRKEILGLMSGLSKEEIDEMTNEGY